MARHTSPTFSSPQSPVAVCPRTRWLLPYGWRSTKLARPRASRYLRDDFHADLFVRAGLERVLDRKHRIERGDGDGELRQVGLAGGQPLELDAGPHQDAGPALGAVLAEQLDHLEGEPRDDRDAQHAREEQPLPVELAERGEHEDGHDH